MGCARESPQAAPASTEASPALTPERGYLPYEKCIPLPGEPASPGAGHGACPRPYHILDRLGEGGLGQKRKGREKEFFVQKTHIPGVGTRSYLEGDAGQ